MFVRKAKQLLGAAGHQCQHHRQQVHCAPHRSPSLPPKAPTPLPWPAPSSHRHRPRVLMYAHTHACSHTCSHLHSRSYVPTCSHMLTHTHSRVDRHTLIPPLARSHAPRAHTACSHTFSRTLTPAHQALRTALLTPGGVSPIKVAWCPVSQRLLCNGAPPLESNPGLLKQGLITAQDPVGSQVTPAPRESGGFLEKRQEGRWGAAGTGQGRSAGGARPPSDPGPCPGHSGGTWNLVERVMGRRAGVGRGWCRLFSSSDRTVGRPAESDVPGYGRRRDPGGFRGSDYTKRPPGPRRGLNHPRRNG